MAKKTNKIVKQQTVTEFKAWLEGLLEFQDANWTPTATQWNAIKERINNLKNEPEIVHVPVPQSGMDMQYNRAEKVQWQTPQQPSHQTAPGTGLLEQPSMMEGMSHGLEVVDDSNSIELLPTGEGMPQERIPIPTSILHPNIQNVSSTIRTSGKKIRTPSDLSGTGYKSPFK